MDKSEMTLQEMMDDLQKYLDEVNSKKTEEPASVPDKKYRLGELLENENHRFVFFLFSELFVDRRDILNEYLDNYDFFFRDKPIENGIEVHGYTALKLFEHPSGRFNSCYSAPYLELAYLSSLEGERLEEELESLKY